MTEYEQRYAELEEEFYEYHPAHGGNMTRMLIEKLIQLEEELRVEKQKHLDTSNWALEQQDRAERAEAIGDK